MMPSKTWPWPWRFFAVVAKLPTNSERSGAIKSLSEILMYS